MLSSELLRTRIARTGQCIFPNYVDPQAKDSLILADRLIEILRICSGGKVSKSEISERISQVESDYKDYKLVRGLFQILERRCTYKQVLEANPSLANKNEWQRNTKNDFDMELTYDPIALRRQVFEESARVGFSLSKEMRAKILEKVATESKMTVWNLETIMWNDLDVNLRLNHFNTISSFDLLKAYNLSLLQTLLFSATEVEFYIKGGLAWKNALRRIKQLGLMYDLHHYVKNEFDSMEDNSLISRIVDISGNENTIDQALICRVNGSTSILKTTNRYGSSMAKLLPSIVFCDKWFLRAQILRLTITGKSKLYHCDVDSEQRVLFDSPPRFGNLQHKEQMGQSQSQSNSRLFDSTVEEKFAKKFISLSTGWNIVREPDPLVLTDHRAFIPDFMFEKYGKRVYFEIVGFWTEEYLRRKLSKISDLLDSNSIHNHKQASPDLIVAVNVNNSISDNGIKSKVDSIFSKIVDKKKLIIYKKDEIPLGPLIQYLRNIEIQMTEYYFHMHQENLTKEISNLVNLSADNNCVISLENLAFKFGIPTESVSRAIGINSMYDKSKGFLQDFLLLDSFLISRKKIFEVEIILKKVVSLSDAMNLLRENGIPEKCIASLITKLGFDIIWNGIDLNNATIAKRKD